MTYLGFLMQFVGIPLLVLVGLTWWELRRGRKLPPQLRNLSPWPVLAAHVVIAVLYTTPWDNYLVATNVWWYNPDLVTGIVLGWVPLEEYIFFVAQTLLTGLWILFLARQLPVKRNFRARPNLRCMTTLVVGVVWLASVAILLAGWQPGTYLGLELAWALLPIMFQLGFGADILWHYRGWVLWGLLPPALYLSFADTLAIGSGTWTIDPAQSLNLFVDGLPIEEFIFFLLTNTLITFGMALMLACESRTRVPAKIQRLSNTDCQGALVASRR